MNTPSTNQLVKTSAFVAIICLATFIFKIPSPTGGYIHLADGFVMLSGLLLGPWYGFLAAALGSSLADLLGGYVVYTVPTFIIKGFSSLVMYYLFHFLSKISKEKDIIKLLLSGVGASIIILVGYFIVDSYILGLGVMVGLTSSYFNMVQCGVGIIVMNLLYSFTKKIL